MVVKDVQGVYIKVVELGKGMFIENPATIQLQ